MTSWDFIRDRDKTRVWNCDGRERSDGRELVRVQDGGQRIHHRRLYNQSTRREIHDSFILKPISLVLSFHLPCSTAVLKSLLKCRWRPESSNYIHNHNNDAVRVMRDCRYCCQFSRVQYTQQPPRLSNLPLLVWRYVRTLGGMLSCGGARGFAPQFEFQWLNFFFTLNTVLRDLALIFL